MRRDVFAPRGAPRGVLPETSRRFLPSPDRFSRRVFVLHHQPQALRRPVLVPPRRALALARLREFPLERACRVALGVDASPRLRGVRLERGDARANGTQLRRVILLRRLLHSLRQFAARTSLSRVALSAAARASASAASIASLAPSRAFSRGDVAF